MSSIPDMDGVEVTMRYRKGESTESRMPIIAMTAHVLQEDREKCLESGIDDIITKPVMQDQLMEVLGKWVVKS